MFSLRLRSAVLSLAVVALTAFARPAAADFAGDVLSFRTFFDAGDKLPFNDDAYAA